MKHSAYIDNHGVCRQLQATFLKLDIVDQFIVCILTLVGKLARNSDLSIWWVPRYNDILENDIVDVLANDGHLNGGIDLNIPRVSLYISNSTHTWEMRRKNTWTE